MIQTAPVRSAGIRPESDMKCQACKSERTAHVSAKCSDLCFIRHQDLGVEHEGYVPMDMNIGGNNYVKFTYCLDCGQIKGAWPLPLVGIEEIDD